MKSIVLHFLNDRSGATAIEYGLIASLIAVAIISAAGLLGNNISNSFNSIANKINSAS